MRVSNNIYRIIAAFIIIITQLFYAQQDNIPITTSSIDALSFFEEGRYKLENLQVPAAAALFDHAIAEDPEFAMAFLYRSQTEGGFNETYSNIEKAVSLIDKVNEGEKHEILYFKALYDGDGVQQMKHLYKLLELYPEDKRVQYRAGRHYYDNGDYPTAIEHLKKAVEIEESFPAPYNLLGYANKNLENYELAEKAFKNYIKYLPNSPNPYDSYAEFLLKQSRYDESIEQYIKALNKDPQFTASMEGIAENYLFKNEFDKARQYFDMEYAHATTFNEKMESLLWKASSYVHENDVENALKIIEQQRDLAESYEHVPEIIAAYNTAGFILVEAGRSNEAMDHFKYAEKLLEDADLPKQTKESITFEIIMNKCLAHIVNENFQLAQELIDEATKLAEKRQLPRERQWLQSRMARLEMEKDNYEKALDHFSMADTGDPYYWYYTAVCYEKLGDIEQANRLFEKIRNWNENTLGYAFVRSKVI
jgi:tetratricopeptide (TPR) repeat protein